MKYTKYEIIESKYKKKTEGETFSLYHANFYYKVEGHAYDDYGIVYADESAQYTNRNSPDLWAEIKAKGF